MTTQLFKSFTYIIVVLFFSSMAHAENVTFNFSEGRAVEAAADKLEEVYSLPISYEDPLYGNDTELKGTLSFSYEVPAADATEDTRKALAASALASVVKNYNAIRGAEIFTVAEGNGGFYIIPVRDVNETGQIESLQAVLSTPISFPVEQLTAANAVRKIASAVTAAANGLELIPYGLGPVPKTPVEIGAQNEPARTVLARVLSQLSLTGEKAITPTTPTTRYEDPTVAYVDVAGAHLSWRALCSASTYILQFRLITPPGLLGGDNAHLPLPESLLEEERKDARAHGLTPVR